MRKLLYHSLAGIMALAAAANYLTPGAAQITADAMPAAPAVNICTTGQSAFSTVHSCTECHDCTTAPLTWYDGWVDVYEDGHFRFASENSGNSGCVVREVLDDAKIVRIPYLFSSPHYEGRVNGGVSGVEYDGTTVKAGEGVRQRELVLDEYISWLTLYDFSADDSVKDDPANYYDLFTSVTILNPKCSIDIPKIDEIVKLLKKDGLTLTIRGLEDSTAEKYAEEHGLPFENALKTEGNFTYCMLGDAVSVYKWENPEASSSLENEREITVPDTVDGLPVTGIEKEAFLFGNTFDTVHLPDTITYIGNDAFAACEHLRNVNFPASLRQLGKGAFCHTALESAVIPESVTDIGEEVFSSCEELTSVVLPDGMKKIPAEMFLSASKLRELTIPDTVTVIGEYALSFCTSLNELKLPANLTEIEESGLSGCGVTALVLPDSLTKLGKFAFSNCTSLKSINIPKGVKALPNRTFEDCHALAQITFSEGLRSIGEDAFKNCGLVSVELPDSVTEIDYGAFYECDSLERVHLPKNLKALPDSLFYRCEALKTVEFPEKPESVGQSAFWETALESVTLPDTVTSVGEYAFVCCNALKTVHLSANLTEIPEGLFSECTALSSVEIPASVKSVGRCAFEACSALTSLTVLSKDCVFSENFCGFLPFDTLTMIGYENSTAQKAAKENYLTFKTLDGSKTILPDKPDVCKFEVREDGAWLIGLTLYVKELTVPAEYEGHPVVGIDSAAVYNGNTEHVVLPETLKVIGKYAFEHSNLKSVTIPDGVTDIREGAFYGCASLKEITIPASVRFIGEDVLTDFDDLTAITIQNGNCEFYEFLDKYQMEWRKEEGKSIPTIYSEKDSMIHGYANYLGVPFCTLDGTPVTEPSKVEYEPKEKPEQTALTEEWYEGTISQTTECTTSSAAAYTVGDINESGSLTISDCILLARVLAEDTTVSVTLQGLQNADMNGSGSTDQDDLTRMLRTLAGIEE